MNKNYSIHVRPLIAACALAVTAMTFEAQAANWVMIQGTEKPDAPAFKFFGVISATYANNFGCDQLVGMRNPNNPASNTAFALNNGSVVNNCRVGPELRNKESDYYLDNLVLGARGNIIPDGINYFVAINGGQNGTNYKPFKTDREHWASLTDATLTFSYIPAVRVRVGMMRKPGPEEQYQAIDAQDYIFPTDFIARVQNERFSDVNYKGSAPISGQGFARGKMDTYGYDQDAGRDRGIMLFDAFKGESWTTTYSVLIGNGNGIHQGDNNDKKDVNLYLSSEYDLPGGQGPQKHGIKGFGWYQKGVRNFIKDAANTPSEDFDRIRYGIGFKALGPIFGENNGRHRLGAELMYADGMVHLSPTGNVADSAFLSYMQFAAEKGNKARGITLDYGYYLNKNWQFDIRYSRHDLLYATAGPNWKPSDERILEFIDIGFNYRFTPNTKLTVNYVFRDVSAPTPVAGGTPTAAIQTDNQNILTGAVGDGFGIRLQQSF